jgi:hypothetical protein
MLDIESLSPLEREIVEQELALTNEDERERG